ncbi:thiaminase II [Neisseria sp. Ec49-e6-T10]|uniref:thiaminase II n=1 Tax=Neisseria sp. Ec49-e6-T10 TaxID=3140744 RepID=UPI003EBE5FA0
MSGVWTQKIWQQAAPIIDQIVQQPFNQELMEGTLPQEKFIHYIEQDALYLKEYGRALANIIPKLQNTEQTSTFLGFLKDTIIVENVLHQQYLSKTDGQTQLKATPTCVLYTQFLLAQTSMNHAAIGMAAILPCFWIYKHVGDYILANYQKNNHPYFEWIQTYSGEEYGQAVKVAIHLADQLAQNQSSFVQKQMDEAFMMATKMEYLFWDSAYQLATWPI